MSRQKKIAIWVMGVIGALLVLMLLLPTFINLEPIKEKIVANLSRRMGGKLAFQRCDLSFLPRPRVVIHHGSLSIPGKVAGTLEALKVYPKILPLLRGRIQIAMLRAEAPHFKMGLAKRPKQGEQRPRAFALGTIGEEVAPVLGLIASKAPGLTLVVDGGRFNLTEGDTSVFRFQDIHGRISLPPDKLEIDVACDSNLWESMSVEGWLTAEDLKGGGRIQVRDFKPQVLTDNLFPLAVRRVGESRVNLDVSFKMDGLEILEGEVEGSFPLLTLLQAHEKLVIRDKSLRGAFHVDEANITVSLTELDLEHPRLKVSGKLFMDRTIPRVRVDLEGREIDIGSTREAALTLAQEVPDIQEIFEMVQGGRVPLITVNAQGSSLADLGKMENIVLKGSVVDGKIILRGADIGLGDLDLGLEDVKGDMVISRGILEAKNVHARLGNSWGREGILRLGLAGEDAPFHLETVMEVDLAELPSFIKGLIRDEAFDKELALIKEIHGSAVGKLVLGESTESTKARVDLSKCNLFARYERIPYPLKIKHGWQFSYDGNKIGIQNLSGTVGKSSFSQINAKLSFEKAPYLEITSGKSSFFLGEIYPWLSSLEGIKDAVKNFKSVQGTVLLSSLSLKGSLSQPEKWDFRTTGEVKNLAVDSMLFPDRLTVTRVGFEATPEKISLTDCETGMLDASLRGSGVLHAYLQGLQKADFTLQGNVGPKAVQWASNLMDIPPKLRVRSPLSISRAQGAWKKDGTVSFAADIGVKNGPNVFIDMLLNPEELTIEKLFIHDKESRASFALKLKERELHLDFKGNLNKTTLDGLLIKNHILTGRIQGDLQTHILMDHPMRSTAQGKLQGLGLGHPLELKIPVQIENFSLDAKGNKLTVESALVTWGESHLNLEGDVKFSEEEFLFDMNLSADGLEWEKIEGLLKEEKGEGDLEQKEKLSVPPVRGTLGIKLGYFKYGKFTWKPLLADISLDHNTVKVEVTEASVCSVSTPGVVEVTPQGLSLDFKPIYRGQKPGHVLACLFGVNLDATGDSDFKGEITTSRAKPEALVKSLRGDFEFTARDGRIYRSVPLSRILGLLNTTEILRGKLPDMEKEGLAYDSFTVKGDLREGKLILKEAILNGSSMELVGQGDIDLIAEKMDLTVLVAPLKTVDFAVKKIPLVRDILQGTLVSIPVRVRGDLANPTVTPLSASAVRSELVGIMKRTFHLSIKVIQPLRRGKGEKNRAPYN